MASSSPAEGSSWTWLVVGVGGLLLCALATALLGLGTEVAVTRKDILEHYVDHDYYVSQELRGELSAEEASVDLSVIIPAFNEEERLPIMLDEMFAFLETRSSSYDVVVVDDHSADSTAAVVKRYADAGRPIQVMRLRENQGKGFAVKCGMLSARGKWKLLVDADGATKFEDLALLEEALDAQKSEIAFGSRRHLVDAAKTKRKWYRNIFMWGLHTIVRVLIIGPRGDVIHDTQCGFKLFSRGAVEKLFLNSRVRRWAFDLELVVLAQFVGLRVTEVPVRWQEIAGSKLNLLAATLQMLRDILRIRLNYFFGFWELRDEPKKTA